MDKENDVYYLFESQKTSPLGRAKILGFAFTDSAALNPKHETRNCPRSARTPHPAGGSPVSKQYKMTKIQITETKELWVMFISVCLGHWNIRYLNLFRISNLEMPLLQIIPYRIIPKPSSLGMYYLFLFLDVSR